MFEKNLVESPVCSDISRRELSTETSVGICRGRSAETTWYFVEIHYFPIIFEAVDPKQLFSPRHFLALFFEPGF